MGRDDTEINPCLGHVIDKFVTDGKGRLHIELRWLIREARRAEAGKYLEIKALE